jgi:tetratricopeptide (TPR) repeat protein
MNRGVKAYKAENYSQAADNFTRATEADPRSHQAWHHLALTCYQEDRWIDKAVEAIGTALEVRAGHRPYVKLAARIYLKAKMTAKAKEYYDELIRLGGSDAMVRKALEAKAAGPPRGSSTRSSETKKEKGKSGLFGKWT